MLTFDELMAKYDRVYALVTDRMDAKAKAKTKAQCRDKPLISRTGRVVKPATVQCGTVCRQKQNCKVTKGELRKVRSAFAGKSKREMAEAVKALIASKKAGQSSTGATYKATAEALQEKNRQRMENRFQQSVEQAEKRGKPKGADRKKQASTKKPEGGQTKKQISTDMPYSPREEWDVPFSTPEEWKKKRPTGQMWVGDVDKREVLPPPPGGYDNRTAMAKEILRNYNSLYPPKKDRYKPVPIDDSPLELTPAQRQKQIESPDGLIIGYTPIEADRSSPLPNSQLAIQLRVRKMGNEEFSRLPPSAQESGRYLVEQKTIGVSDEGFYDTHHPWLAGDLIPNDAGLAVSYGSEDELVNMSSFLTSVENVRDPKFRAHQKLKKEERRVKVEETRKKTQEASAKRRAQQEKEAKRTKEAERAERAKKKQREAKKKAAAAQKTDSIEDTDSFMKSLGSSYYGLNPSPFYKPFWY